jgi:hypothetical protein
MNVQGKVIEIFTTQQVSEKFRKREFVLEIKDNGGYVETVKFECIQNNCELLDKIRSGEEVDVAFNLKGRAWTNNQGQKSYFNTLQVWKITSLGSGSVQSSEASGAESSTYSQPTFSDDSADDLPF